jgi:hypothetical protein
MAAGMEFVIGYFALNPNRAELRFKRPTNCSGELRDGENFCRLLTKIGCELHGRLTEPRITRIPRIVTENGWLSLRAKVRHCRNRTWTALAENQALRSPDSQVDSHFKRERGETFASLSAWGIEEIEGADARATLERDIRAQEPQ